MRYYTLQYVKETIEGIDNNYKLICRASKLLGNFAKGAAMIDCKDDMKSHYVSLLYRRFMHAYTNYIVANPNCIKSLLEDCEFNATCNGEFFDINNPEI